MIDDLKIRLMISHKLYKIIKIILLCNYHDCPKTTFFIFNI